MDEPQYAPDLVIQEIAINEGFENESDDDSDDIDTPPPKVRQIK